MFKGRWTDERETHSVTSQSQTYSIIMPINKPPIDGRMIAQQLDRLFWIEVMIAFFRT